MSQAPLSTVKFVADWAGPKSVRLPAIVYAGLLLLGAAALAFAQAPYRDAYGYGDRGWLAWLAYPLERNPALRLPRVGGNLNDIAFAADGKTGVAVGAGGVFLTTGNGGIDWIVSKLSPATALSDVAISADGSRKIALAADGSVVALPGEALNTLADAGRGYKWLDMSNDGTVIWVVSPSGEAARSTDGGASWVRRSLPAANELTAVAFDATGRIGKAAEDTGGVVDFRFETTRPSAAAVAPQTADEAAKAAVDASPADDQALTTPSAIGFDSTGSNGAPTLRSAVYVPDGQPLFSKAGSPEPSPRATANTPRALGGEPLDQQRQIASEPEFEDPADQFDFGPTVALTAVPGTTIFGGIRKLVLGGDSELFIGDGTATGVTPPLLNAIALSSTSRGWAVGEQGRIFAISDGVWAPQSSRTTADLAATTATGNGQHVWAAGSDGTLIATVDGGATWFDQLRRPGPTPDGSYWRFPAPWFYLTLGLLGGFIAYARRPLPVESQPGVSAMGSTDAPAATLADDKLQFAPLARGISRYLRNANTQPPLTLAISGEWGSGKSSLMRMVCEDLRDHGNHPVWFNAWHHQDEEQLLAALLAAIRDKALPPWLSPDGLKFRIQLFLIRARRKLVATLALVGIASFILAVLSFTTSEDWNRWAGEVAELFPGKESAENAGLGTRLIQGLTGLAGLAGLITTVTGISRALRAFGANPAVLLTSTIDNFKLRDATAQVHFRTRFQRQFDDVTEALPYPLVIVIDDLDRCRPETVLQVMESVNFLMTSGKCFVLFGMSTPRVQAALALSFKDIAQEFVEIDPDIATPATPDDRTQAERANRLNYAGDYLQKLINLEIRVPAREDIAPHLLLTRSRQPEADEQFAAARRWFGLLWPLALVAAVAGAAWWEGSQLFAPDAPTDQAPPTPPPASAPSAGVSGDVAATPAAPAPPPTATSATASKPVEVIPGQSGGRDWPLIVLLGGLLAGIAALQYRRRKTDEAVADTDAFSEALRVWTPIVARRSPSPRAIKRFGNRLRYLAMLQQAEDAEPDGGGLLPDWLARRFAANDAGDPPQPSSAKVDVVAEHRIVALGAIHAVFGDRDWRNWLTLPRPPGGASPYDDVDKAIIAYTACGWRWPPTSQELDAFERSLKGIRLGGEVDVLGDGGDPTNSPGPASATAPQPQQQQPKRPLRKEQL